MKKTGRLFFSILGASFLLALWLGFISQVAAQSDEAWRTYTIEDGLASNKISAIAVDHEGHIWVGGRRDTRVSNGSSGGLSIFDGQAWTTYTTTHGLAHPWVNTIVIDKQNRKWFGTHGGGVTMFDGITWTTYSAVDGLASNIIFDLAVDQEGHIWAATSGGVSKFDGQAWINYREVGSINTIITTIAIDEAGYTWLGTDDGLLRFDESRWVATPLTIPKSITISIPPTVSFEAKPVNWANCYSRLIDNQTQRIYYDCGWVVEGIKEYPTLVLDYQDESLLKVYNLEGKLALDSKNGWLYIDQGTQGLAVLTTTATAQSLVYAPDIEHNRPVAHVKN